MKIKSRNVSYLKRCVSFFRFFLRKEKPNGDYLCNFMYVVTFHQVFCKVYVPLLTEIISNEASCVLWLRTTQQCEAECSKYDFVVWYRKWVESSNVYESQTEYCMIFFYILHQLYCGSLRLLLWLKYNHMRCEIWFRCKTAQSVKEAEFRPMWIMQSKYPWPSTN